MKIQEVINRLNATVVNIPPDYNREIEGGYCGDFLSWVMGRAPEGTLWFTVVNNVNVSAVAHLTDVACTVICEGVECDTALIDRARQQGICLIRTNLTVFDAIKAYIK
ncbi:MAG: hypothetical protein PHW00_06080 [Clostridia bacterium]|nr:hypothetical protein [Clostridia bacterium]